MRTPRILVAVLVGFVAMLVVNALAAALVIDPLFGDDYPEVTGDGAQFDWPLLVGGYLVIAAVIGFWYENTERRRGWLGDGAVVGVASAAVTFAAVHLVQAGYTIIDNEAWVLSGLLDMAGPIVAALVIAFIMDGRGEPSGPASRIGAQLTRLGERADRTSGARRQRQITELEAVSEQIEGALTRLRSRAE